MSKVRLDKLVAAIKKLATQERRMSRFEGEGLATITVGGQSFYQLPEDEALRVTDILLGMGVPTGLCFERDSANLEAWTVPTVEAEIASLRAWLAEADRVGREVVDRAAIEGLIARKGGPAITIPQDAIPDPRPAPPAPPMEPYSAPGASEDTIIAERARQRDGIADEELGAWNRVMRPGKPRQNDEIQDALARRQRRQGK